MGRKIWIKSPEKQPKSRSALAISVARKRLPASNWETLNFVSLQLVKSLDRGKCPFCAPSFVVILKETPLLTDPRVL